jgi:hypothetical protein
LGRSSPLGSEHHRLPVLVPRLCAGDGSELFAQPISRFVFKRPVSAREGVGIVMIVIGVVLLVWSY